MPFVESPQHFSVSLGELGQRWGRSKGSTHEFMLERKTKVIL